MSAFERLNDILEQVGFTKEETDYLLGSFLEEEAANYLDFIQNFAGKLDEPKKLYS